MSSTVLYIGILIAFIIGAMLVAVALFFTFKKIERVDLVQGKLANSDSSIKNAIVYLKITNEWGSKNGD